MYWLQHIVRTDSNVSHHSIWWMSLFIGPGRCPWCRPYSVACTVATIGILYACFRLAAACATSQSWAWITLKFLTSLMSATAFSSSATLNCRVQGTHSSWAMSGG
jgi:hypothetical protein